MIFEAARLALTNLLAPETRSVFWKVIGLTLLVLTGLWFSLRGFFVSYILPWFDGYFSGWPEWTGWFAFILGILASVGLALAMALLLSSVTAIIAGLFLDDVADVVERRDYPQDPPGHAMPLVPAIVSSLKFFGVLLAGNIVAFVLLLVPGVNLIAFFVVNGYLLGREFFEFAAMRFRSPQEARLFRAKHSGTVFLGGLVVACFLAVPFLNLLTPLFAAGMMVHLHKLLSRRDPSVALKLGR